MITLPSADLPPHLRLALLTEHMELELLRLCINAGTEPAQAVAIITDQNRNAS